MLRRNRIVANSTWATVTKVEAVRTDHVENADDDRVLGVRGERKYTGIAQIETHALGIRAIDWPLIARR